VESLSGHPETHTTLWKGLPTISRKSEVRVTYHSQSNSNEDQVDNGKENHPRRGCQTSLVDVQPENTTDAETEPGSEQSSLEA
jgi:hypothetical protein